MYNVHPYFPLKNLGKTVYMAGDGICICNFDRCHQITCIEVVPAPTPISHVRECLFIHFHHCSMLAHFSTFANLINEKKASHCSFNFDLSYLEVICISFLWTVLTAFAHFSIEFLAFFIVFCKSYLHNRKISLLVYDRSCK